MKYGDNYKNFLAIYRDCWPLDKSDQDLLLPGVFGYKLQENGHVEKINSEKNDYYLKISQKGLRLISDIPMNGSQLDGSRKLRLGDKDVY